jgi:hypothetical protein
MATLEKKVRKAIDLADPSMTIEEATQWLIDNMYIGRSSARREVLSARGLFKGEETRIENGRKIVRVY